GEVAGSCAVGAAAPQDDPQNSLRFQSSWPGSRPPRHNSQDRESSVIIGVPKESYPGERRIALVPLVIPTLAKAGFEIVVEAGAGMEAGYPDVQYAEKGAKVVSSRPEDFRAADIVVQVLCYGSNDINGRDDLALMRSVQVLVAFLRSLVLVVVVQEIASAGIIAFVVELIPLIMRAQSMDALSSMGTICGYKAVLVSAETLPLIFPMLTTAAGTIAPA